MLTYKDLRKGKKGIVLLCIEVFTVIAIILYEYFIETHVFISTSNLATIKKSNGLLILLGSILLFTLLSYFIYYSKTLGFIYQLLAAYPLGLLVSDLISGSFLLSIICCAIFTTGLYYIQILRPISMSRKEYFKNREANGVTQYKYLGTLISGQKKLNILLDRYDSLNNKAMHIFSNMRSSGKKYPKQFSFISKQVLSIKEVILADLEELCEANWEDFEDIYTDISISLDELDSDVSSLHTLFNLHLSEPMYRQTRQESFSTKEPQRDTPPIPKSRNESFDFFLGCNDSTTLKKRYRDLMKTYHSDGTSGNEQITVEINAAYQDAKTRLN